MHSLRHHGCCSGFNSVLRELRSYQEIQPNEAAKFGELLRMQYYWERNAYQRWQVAQDLVAASTRDVRDVLKYLHKFVSELSLIKKYLSGTSRFFDDVGIVLLTSRSHFAVSSCSWQSCCIQVL